MAPMGAAPGLIVAAPASGSGKTTVTLALLRALAGRGLRVASLKVGPDYIDPAFHAAASGRRAAISASVSTREASHGSSPRASRSSKPWKET